LELVLVSVEAEYEVWVHRPVGVQAGLLELVWVSEGCPVGSPSVNGVSTSFVAVRDGFIGGTVVPFFGIVVLVHHDGPGRGGGVCGAGVAPPASSVGAVSVGTGGACPLGVTPLADGAVGAVDSTVTVST
jgi:hypothetical protein